MKIILYILAAPLLAVVVFAAVAFLVVVTPVALIAIFLEGIFGIKAPNWVDDYFNAFDD
jgi:hypothetical protein